jgi:hypothetical protein
MFLLMNEQLLTDWTIFFEALGLKCRQLSDAPTPGLEVHDLFDPGKHGVWMPVPKFPEHSLIEDGSRYADLFDKHVFFVIGPPEPPQVKQWEDGFLYAEGAVGISLAPSSAGLGDTPPFLFDPRWHALQEDYWGSLDMRPLYADAMPLRKKEYTTTSFSPAILGGPILGFYVGCGRSPAGPRLRSAYEAVRSAK